MTSLKINQHTMDLLRRVRLGSASCGDVCPCVCLSSVYLTFSSTGCENRQTEDQEKGNGTNNFFLLLHFITLLRLSTYSSQSSAYDMGVRNEIQIRKWKWKWKYGENNHVNICFFLAWHGFIVEFILFYFTFSILFYSILLYFLSLFCISCFFQLPVSPCYWVISQSPRLYPILFYPIKSYPIISSRSSQRSLFRSSPVQSSPSKRNNTRLRSYLI